MSDYDIINDFQDYLEYYYGNSYEFYIDDIWDYVDYECSWFGADYVEFCLMKYYYQIYYD
jgi:hypothetical protein